MSAQEPTDPPQNPPARAQGSFVLSLEERLRKRKQPLDPEMVRELRIREALRDEEAERRVAKRGDAGQPAEGSAGMLTAVRPDAEPVAGDPRALGAPGAPLGAPGVRAGAAPSRLTPAPVAPQPARLVPLGAPPRARAARTAPTVAARPHARHLAVAASFLLLVILPMAAATWYLWLEAADRFASTAGFSVRTEDTSSAMEMLGGIVDLPGASSSDTDILYEFIQSQEIVALVDDRLDLRAMWSKPGPGEDPLFAYRPPGTIEDLTAHWNRMVSVYLDSGTGLIEVEAQAFAAQDAHAIGLAIYEESGALINRLSAIAQEDATRFARDELDAAVERLKAAREATTLFRNRTQIVDPDATVQTQMGLLASLEGQLATTLIDLDMLRLTAPSGDPRVEQAERRVEVIEARVEDERAKLGIGTGAGAGDGTAFADLVGEYERLQVDQEFASQAYVGALAAYDAALAEGRRQSRYLAAHVRPTLPERATHPERWTLLALVAIFAGLAWTILTLAAYALRDRR